MDSSLSPSRSSRKRTHWDRDIADLQDKLDAYQAMQREHHDTSSLLNDILDLVQDLHFDRNVSILAKCLDQSESIISDLIQKRKRSRTSNGDSSTSSFTVSSLTHQSTLQNLFNQSNRSALHDDNNNMHVSLQFLIFNNEFIIQYGPEQSSPESDDDTNSSVPKLQQICHYNPITNAFLQEMSLGILPTTLLESLDVLPHVKFYDGGIIVELLDYREEMRLKERLKNTSSSHNTQDNQQPSQSIKLLLKPSISSSIQNAKQFLEENYPSLSESERNEALQQIVQKIQSSQSVSTDAELNLHPTTDVARISNAMHFNRNKHRFRRLVKRTVSRTLMPSNPAPMTMTIQSSMMRTRKHDHSLLNHIVIKGWKSQKVSDMVKVREEPVKPNPDFMNNLIKQQKQQQEDSKKKGIEVKTPREFLEKTKDFSKNYRKTVKIIQFSGTQDQRVWRVEIFPAHKGRRYDCVLIPSHQQASKWVIGSKHAAELYAERLKDMFTSRGKTFLTKDMDVDYEAWEEKRKQSSQNSGQHNSSNTNTPPMVQPNMNNREVNQVVNPNQRSYVRQIAGNMRVQNGQMQSFTGSNAFQMPQGNQAALQGNLHQANLLQRVNQKQQNKRE